MEVVQAQVPPRKDYNNPSCIQTIFSHVFADSYGIPYVGKWVFKISIIDESMSLCDIQ